jgi:hypothetical protein
MAFGTANPAEEGNSLPLDLRSPLFYFFYAPIKRIALITRRAECQDLAFLVILVKKNSFLLNNSKSSLSSPDFFCGTDSYARALVSCPRNSMYFVAIKMGRRQGGPSRTGGGSGAYQIDT